MIAVVDIIASLLVFLGAILALSAAIGLVRFPDTPSRMHAVAKPQTLGLILTVTGAILKILSSPAATFSERGDIGMLVLIIVFSLITSPVIAQKIGGLAIKEHLYKDSHLAHNDVLHQPASEQKQPPAATKE